MHRSDRPNDPESIVDFLRSVEPGAAEPPVSETRIALDDERVSRIIGEIKEAQAILSESELRDFFSARLNSRPRSEADIRRLLKLAQAKAISLCYERVFETGIQVFEGTGYYSRIGKENVAKLDEVLALKEPAAKKYAKLRNDWFVPSEMCVDGDDLRNELSEVVLGITRHEIGEVLFNDFQRFVLSQVEMGEKCERIDGMGKWWGKDYAFFINAVGDPRINHYSAKMSHEAARDIRYAELAGVCGLVGKIGALPDHLQFLMLANCRETQKYAPELVALIESECSETAVRFYREKKTALAEIAREPDMNAFYSKSEALWADYVKIVDRKYRTLERLIEAFLLLPMPSGCGMLYDEENDLLIPVPMDEIDHADGIEWMRKAVGVNKGEARKAGKPMDRKKAMEIEKRAKEAVETGSDDPNGRGNGKNAGGRNRTELDQSREPGGTDGDQERSGKRPGRGSGKSVPGGMASFEPLRSTTDQFIAAMREILPKERSKFTLRNPVGRIRMPDFLRSRMGRNPNYRIRLEHFVSHFAVFWIVVDSSGSTWEAGKIVHFRNAAYSFADALSIVGIPFDMMHYGNGTFVPTVVHSIEDGAEFSRDEREELASLGPTGGQFDVECLESSAERVLPVAEEFGCTPFLILICDGMTNLALKNAVERLRGEGAVVIWVGVGIPPGDRKYFRENFWENGIVVDLPSRLAPELIQYLNWQITRLQYER